MPTIALTFLRRHYITRRSIAMEALLLAPPLVWSFNFAVTKYGVSHGFRPDVFASLRYTLAAVILVMASGVWRRDFGISRHDLGILMVLAVLVMGANQLSFTYAVSLAAASTIALIFGLIPIVVALISRLWDGHDFGRAHWVAAGLSVAGVAFIVGAGGQTTSRGALAIVLGVCAVLTFAFYMVRVVSLTRRYSPFHVNTVVVTGTAAALAVVAIPGFRAQDWHVGLGSWAAVAYSGVVALAFAQVLWLTGLKHAGAGRTSLYVNVQPFVAALIAAVALAEPITPLTALGGGFIAAAVLISRGNLTSTTPTYGELRGP